MHKNHKRRFALVATTVAAMLVGGGVAVAYWTTTGTGTGSAATGTSSAFTITQDSTNAGLTPGGAAQNLNFTINNTGTSPQYVAGVAISITGTSSASCAASNFAVTQPTITAGNIPTGPTAYLGSTTGASIQLVETGTNQDACKNVTVGLAYLAS